MEKERRSFKIEVRQADDGTKFLAGTPIVYNRKSEDMGFFEYIGHGAAKEAVKNSDARLLYGHNSETLLPLARQKSGTLRATEDKKGVHIEADPPKKNPFVDALIESIEREDIGEMSFGFTVLEDKWEGLDTNKPTRTITKIGEIFDYSYVAFAAYNDTTVALRTLETAKEAAKDVIPDNDTISVTVKDETFEFTGETRFDEAVKKIESTRSEANPTITTPDSADPDPKIIPDADLVRDETLDKINDTITRLKG